MRLLMLESHEEHHEHWNSVLQSAGFDLDRFHSFAEAEEALRPMAAHYATLFINKDLPEGSGIDWLRSRRQAGLQTPAVVITRAHDLESRIKAFDSGADEALCRGIDGRELVARLRALLRRHPLLQPESLSAGNVHIDLACRQLLIMGRPVTIPRRELGILEMLLRAFTRTLTREFLEQSIYGARSEVSPNSIEVRISRLRRILDRHGADVEIETIRGVGYRLRTSDRLELLGENIGASVADTRLLIA